MRSWYDDIIIWCLFLGGLAVLFFILLAAALTFLIKWGFGL